MPPGYDPFSPDNQRRLCHQAASRNGERIPLEFEFTELDVSARKDRPRPGLDAALKVLLRGKIKTLYVAKLDRLSRRGMGHVGLILDELEKAGARIVFVADGLDTSKHGARQLIAMLAEQARAESDNTSWRVGQWHLYNRRAGLWKQQRPFGYLVENGRLKPHPNEAPIVRRMINDFLRGVSLYSIARRLNDEGVKPPGAVRSEEARAKGHRAKGQESDQQPDWHAAAVRRVLSQPVVAALVSHKRQLVYDENGEPISAGEGIASLAERARILAELERRSLVVQEGAAERVGKRTGGGRPAEHLLVGFVRCGECGAAATRVSSSSSSAHYYRCSSARHAGNCRGGFIRETYAEGEVASRLRSKLAALEPGDPLLDEIAEQWFAQKLPDQGADRRVLEEGREAAKARITDLYAARYQRGEFTAPEEIAVYEQLMQRLREQRDAAEAALAKLPPLPEFDVATLLDGELSVDTWPVLPVSRKRFLVGLAVHQVWIFSTDERLDDRIVVVWHGEEPPKPTGKRTNVRRDDGRLAVVIKYRSNQPHLVAFCAIHRRVCSHVPYLPSTTRSETGARGSGKAMLVEAMELPSITKRYPVKICKSCQPELPPEIVASLRVVHWKWTRT
ncbi:MAG TPA: recombinase family protein [Actinomycetes bacterium]|nr:recombinase family protein [Actinomycetes bacterium]